MSKRRELPKKPRTLIMVHGMCYSLETLKEHLEKYPYVRREIERVYGVKFVRGIMVERVASSSQGVSSLIQTDMFR